MFTSFIAAPCLVEKPCVISLRWPFCLFYATVSAFRKILLCITSSPFYTDL